MSTKKDKTVKQANIEGGAELILDENGNPIVQDKPQVPGNPRAPKESKPRERRKALGTEEARKLAKLISFTQRRELIALLTHDLDTDIAARKQQIQEERDAKDNELAALEGIA